MNLLFLPKTTKETLESFGIDILTVDMNKLSKHLDWNTITEIGKKTKLIDGILKSKNISLDSFTHEKDYDCVIDSPTSLKEEVLSQEELQVGYNYYNMLKTCDLAFTEDHVLIIYEADNDPEGFEVRLAKTIEETYGLDCLIESSFYQEL